MFGEAYCFDSKSSVAYLWLSIISRAPRPQLLPLLHTNARHFKNPTTLSTAHTYIYLKQTACDGRWRGKKHRTDPASLREVNGIYSAYFLHAALINLHRCQYIQLVLCFTRHWFSTKASIVQERHNTFRVLLLNFHTKKDIQQWFRIELVLTILALSTGVE